MSTLTIYPQDDPAAGRRVDDVGEIRRELAAIGVTFERWQAPGATGARADRKSVV